MLERWSHYAALPLRIVVGCSFVVLGLQKLGGYFDGPGLARTAELMASGGGASGLRTFNFSGWVMSLSPRTSVASAGMTKSPACFGKTVKL